MEGGGQLLGRGEEVGEGYGGLADFVTEGEGEGGVSEGAVPPV